ncbi:hypothetical protein [Sphingobacterium faecium]|uniref:hypothetical protein n=1 Tax=Sphingobacterium faecium TaxID=34087 RepID=UPI003208FCC3
MATSWFKYTGGDPSQSCSYTAINGNPNCPPPKQRLCAIFAQVQLIGGVVKPVITGALQTEITFALMTKAESANVRLCP